MTEKQIPKDDLKLKRAEQFQKNISYHLASLRDAQDNWQVFSGYLGTGKFGEEGNEAYDTVINNYSRTSNFKDKFDAYNFQRKKMNNLLYQPSRKVQDGEVLEWMASSTLKSFEELSQLNPKSLDDLLENVGSKDEKRKEFADELQKIREKEMKHYIETGKQYKYTPEEEKVVEQTEAYVHSAWETFNMSNSIRAMNEYFQSKAYAMNNEIHEKSGLGERKRNEKLKEEKKTKEKAAKNNKK